MSECKKCEEPLDESELNEWGLCEFCEDENRLKATEMSYYNEEYDFNPDPQETHEINTAVRDIRRQQERSNL